MRQVEEGQWIVAGTIREDLDWGRVFSWGGDLFISWESCGDTTWVPMNADGTWPDDVAVYGSRADARDAFEARYTDMEV